jgi:DNA-binding GntR family transcriptional regulator
VGNALSVAGRGVWVGEPMPEPQPIVAPLVVQTVQDAVADRLRRLILSGQLVPGQRLVQAELAELLGVSRTPIRDALNRLQHEGLVTLSSYKGASVARFSASDLEEIYAIRAGLESHATYLAARRITKEGFERLEACLGEMSAAFGEGDFERLLGAHHEFHATIYESAAPPRFLSLILQYLELSNVYQRLALSMGRGAYDPVVEHQDILATLERRDPEAAGALMRSHLQLTAAELQDLFQEEQ